MSQNEQKDVGSEKINFNETYPELSKSENNTNKSEELKYNNNDYIDLIENIKSKDELIKHKALIGLNKLLKEKKEKSEQKIIFNNIIEIIYDIFVNNKEQSQFEALRCLIFMEKKNDNIENQIYVLKEEKFKNLLSFLVNSLENYKKLKLYFLNKILIYISIIIKDNNAEFEFMKTNNIIDKIINILNDNKDNAKIIKNSIKVLTKLYTDKDILINKSDNTKVLIQLFEKFIFQYENNIKIIINILKILEKLTYENSEEKIISNYISQILNCNILSKVIKFTEEKDKVIVLASLKIIGNIAQNAENSFTQKLIDSNALKALKRTLGKEYSEAIRIETAFILSNIAAGTQEQIIALIKNDFFQLIKEIILNEEEGKIKYNCLWTLYNLTCLKDGFYLENLVEGGILKIIIDRFKIDTGDILSCSLEALDNILKYEKGINNPANMNIIRAQIEELNIYNEILALKQNNMEEINQNKINHIINNYFLINP